MGCGDARRMQMTPLSLQMHLTHHVRLRRSRVNLQGEEQSTFSNVNKLYLLLNLNFAGLSLMSSSIHSVPEGRHEFSPAGTAGDAERAWSSPGGTTDSCEGESSIVPQGLEIDCLYYPAVPAGLNSCCPSGTRIRK